MPGLAGRLTGVGRTLLRALRPLPPGTGSSLPPPDPRVVRAHTAALVALMAAGAVLILVFDAFATDEDDYMPYALDDLANGRNPYATEHTGTNTVNSPWWNGTYTWRTTFVYMPAVAVLQVPGLDYRWSALAAYGLLLLALRGRHLAFFAFGNPAVLWLAASGFNDFPVLALLAWAPRYGRRVPEWVACAGKQFAAPLVAADCLLRRDWRRLAVTGAAAGLITLPFVVWDPMAFWNGAAAVHAGKVGIIGIFWNYLLYPAYFAAVMWPEARAARRKAASPVT